MEGEGPLLLSGKVKAEDSLFKILVETFSPSACMAPY